MCQLPCLPAVETRAGQEAASGDQDIRLRLLVFVFVTLFLNSQTNGAILILGIEEVAFTEQCSKGAPLFSPETLETSNVDEGMGEQPLTFPAAI